MKNKVTDVISKPLADIKAAPLQLNGFDIIKFGMLVTEDDQGKDKIDIIIKFDQYEFEALFKAVPHIKETYEEVKQFILNQDAANSVKH